MRHLYLVIVLFVMDHTWKQHATVACIITKCFLKGAYRRVLRYYCTTVTEVDVIYFIQQLFDCRVLCWYGTVRYRAYRLIRFGAHSIFQKSFHRFSHLICFVLPCTVRDLVHTSTVDNFMRNQNCERVK